MASNLRLLLFFYTFASPKFARLPLVTFNKTEFDPTFDYGKKSTLFDLKSSPQDLVAYLFPQKAKLYNP
jgi:hypothetical protein